jgi:hypothetical protein
MVRDKCGILALCAKWRRFARFAPSVSFVSFVLCAPSAGCSESFARQSLARAAALRPRSARLRSARLARLVRWFVRVVHRRVGRANVLMCRQLCVARRRRQQRIRLGSQHHRRDQVRDSVPSSPLNSSASRAERSLAERGRSAAACRFPRRSPQRPKHHRRFQVRDSVPSSPLDFSASRAERSLAERGRSAAACRYQRRQRHHQHRRHSG